MENLTGPARQAIQVKNTAKYNRGVKERNAKREPDCNPCCVISGTLETTEKYVYQKS